MLEKCPQCGSVNVTDEHLLREYKEGMRPCFGRMFGRNARKAQNEVAKELLSRGITELPNIFGAIPIKSDW